MVPSASPWQHYSSFLYYTHRRQVTKQSPQLRKSHCVSCFSATVTKDWIFKNLYFGSQSQRVHCIMACWQEHGGSQQLQHGWSGSWETGMPTLDCHFVTSPLLFCLGLQSMTWYYLHSGWVPTVDFIIVLGVALVEKEHVLTTFVSALYQHDPSLLWT